MIRVPRFALGGMLAALGAAQLLAGDEIKTPAPAASPTPVSPLAAAEAAVALAAEQEAKAEFAWNTLEMARSATREIARSERAKATAVLQATEAALQAAEQDPERAAEVKQRLESLQAAADRLMAETRTANDRATELFSSETNLRDVMAAHRRAEQKLLELKTEAAAGEAADQSVAARRAVLECQALACWEWQMWANVAVDTANQLIEQSSGAADLLDKMAALKAADLPAGAWRQFATALRERKASAEALITKKRAEVNSLTPKVYALRTAAVGGLAPLEVAHWDRAKARHLLVRAGFGGTPAEVDRLCKLGLYGAVDYLLEFHRQPAPQVPLAAAPPEPADPLTGKLRNTFVQREAAGGRKGRADNGQIAALRRAWLRRMVESPRPLEEKLTLFWHGLFATQNSVVQNSYAMQRQNELLREHASGNYGGLLYGLVHDAAMIRYLDNNRNVKGQPNENLAREIMELFSMGADQGYTERDIVEAARALTGYNYDNGSGSFRYYQEQHDNGDKCIFGKTGPWSGDDLVRLILEQPATSRFVSRRLFEFFAYLDPEVATVDGLASVLKAHNYEIEPLLRNLLLSAEFYSERSRGQTIKCPVQLVVGTLRDLGVKKGVDYAQLDAAIRDMGQNLFEPPDVKGWRYGREWINSQRLFVRYNTAASLVHAATDPGRGGVDLMTFVPVAARQSPKDVVAYLSGALLTSPLDEAQQKELADFCCDLPGANAWNEQADLVRSRLQQLVAILVSLPGFQMT